MVRGEDAMKYIEAALIRFPSLHYRPPTLFDRGRIIRFACPDWYGLTERKCESQSCEDCWNQEMRDDECTNSFTSLV